MLNDVDLIKTAVERHNTTSAIGAAVMSHFNHSIFGVGKVYVFFIQLIGIDLEEEFTGGGILVELKHTGHGGHAFGFLGYAWA